MLSTTLRLPSKREVQCFREKRLLTHLHHQLVHQIQNAPQDWKLHFQLANLLAFTGESFYGDRTIDRIKSEFHYQQSLTLLREVHQNHIHHRNDIHRPSNPRSPIPLLQSESETVAELSDYVVSPHIAKGYTECFFGYGKYLVLNRRLNEGIHNLLECASWYHDSFVDPSCLSSLILPPQFLFQDSVKKHCITFQTLTKYISRVLADEQRRLDKQFKQMEMETYMKQYDQYLDAYHEDEDEDEDSMSAFSLESARLNSVDSLKFEPLRLSQTDMEPLHWSDASLSPMRSSMLSPTLSRDPSYTSSVCESKQRHTIHYHVYPQAVQELVAQYEHLCGSCHRLGILLSDFLRYSEAKREFSRALAVFRKLKMKPALYEELVYEIRNAQTHSIHSPTGRERAQYLAKKLQSPSPRNGAFKFSSIHPH